MSYTHNPENPWLFSRLFNPWRCSLNENSRLLVTEVIEKVLHTEVSKESRRRKRKPEDHKRFLNAIEAITCDLIHNHLSDQRSGIAISRSNRVLSRTSRYKNEVLNKTIPYLLDVLKLPELFCFRWNWKNLYHELVTFRLCNYAAILILFFLDLFSLASSSFLSLC